MRRLAFGSLAVHAADSTAEMAQAAAADLAQAASLLLREHASINIVFSGARSQGAFHAALRVLPGIDWGRIHAYAVDEFWSPGLPPECAVAAQPRRDLYRHVPLASVDVIDAHAPDPEIECRRYEALVAAHPPHIACLGVGVSGHIALNEPGDTDFHDRRIARVVRVVESSRRQLEADPNFSALPSIPERGITLTLPILLAAARILVVVPYAEKSPIVARLRDAPVSPALPATILKTRDNAVLYLDPDSSRELYRDPPPLRR